MMGSEKNGLEGMTVEKVLENPEDRGNQCDILKLNSLQERIRNRK